jgi:hypothetical protein
VCRWSMMCCWSFMNSRCMGRRVMVVSCFCSMCMKI